MKNQQKMIVLPINVAHLMSLSGMLREFAPENIHGIFSAQVFVQSAMQGIPMEDLSAEDYEFLKSKTIDFSIPAGCVAEVGSFLMSASKNAETEAMENALGFLIQQWTPFVTAAISALEDDTFKPFHPRNRLSDFGPEDLN